MNATIGSNVLSVVEWILPDEDTAIAAFAKSYCLEPVLSRLAAFLAENFGIELTTDPDIVSGFITDESHLPGVADGVCRPRTLRDVAAILRTCFCCSVPITVCAGRSNLTGSATPEGGIMLSMAAIEEPALCVDEIGKTVTAPVGMMLEELRQAVLMETSSKLCYPVDPTSRAEASVGGSIACNASGFTRGAPGATRDWVAGLGVVLPCGTYVAVKRGEVVSKDGVFLLRAGDRTTEIPVPMHARFLRLRMLAAHFLQRTV